MKKAVLAVTLLALGGCGGFGDSRANPLNWFGSDPDAAAQAQRPAEGRLVPEGGYQWDRDDREAVGRISEMEIHPVRGGAVVRAASVPPEQGWSQAALVPENQGVPEGGVLTLRFAASPPPQAIRVGRESSREITAAIHLEARDLSGVREIVVVGDENRMSARR